MRILVTGSQGFIGRHLTGELRQRGYTVYGLDLAHGEEELAFALRGDGISPTYARCDVSEYRQLARVIEHWQPEMVYHTAAEFGRWSGEDGYERLWTTNVIGTKHLIQLQEHYRFRLVHCSSSEVYGDWDGVMHESVPQQHAIPLLNDYAMTKAVNEQQISNGARQYGTESVIVRFFNVYGPGEQYSPYRSVNCRFLYCALRGWPFTVHRGHRRTSTYVDDAVRTLAAITERFLPGAVYNLAGSREHTIEELAETVLAVTGVLPALATYADAEPMTTLVKRADITRAIQDLGHEERISLLEGLRRMAIWMKGEYGL